MRKLSLWLAAGLLVGCGNPPGEVMTEGATTESSPTSGPSTTVDDSTVGSSTVSTTMSASTGPEVCPPLPPEDGGYDPCPGLCGGGGQCFSDHVDYAVCTRGCFMDCNCWGAPNDGDAPARCSDELLESTSVCVLDCSSGQTCPGGMFCVADLGICAFPFPGSETAESSGSSDSSSSDSGSSSGGSSSGGSSSGGSSSDSGGSSSTDGAMGTGTSGATGTSTT